MVNLSIFGERLSDLMFEHGEMSSKALGAKLNIPAPNIVRYRQGKHAPNIKNLIKIADFFNCSTDFLLGLEDEIPSLTFKTCPPFATQLVFIVKHFNYTFKEFYQELKIPESSFFEWKNGSSLPTIDNILKIAEHFGCRVDFILGREN